MTLIHVAVISRCTPDQKYHHHHNHQPFYKALLGHSIFTLKYETTANTKNSNLVRITVVFQMATSRMFRVIIKNVVKHRSSVAK